ncbi:hypothetical protein O9993_03190 [Vibrio lentus]|nr:hypothetical protein [Vibrio lentus]
MGGISMKQTRFPTIKTLRATAKVIVIYQDISLDFSEATITIGFPTQPIKIK